MGNTAGTVDTSAWIRKAFYYSHFVILVVILFCLFDYVFNSSSILNALPSSPGEYLWFALLFNIPHIVGSHIVLLDSEYIKFYKSHLIIGGLISLVPVFLSPDFIKYYLLFAVVWATIHVYQQQTGIGRLVIQDKRDSHYTWWSRCVVFLGTVMVIEGLFQKMKFYDYSILIKYFVFFTFILSFVMAFILYFKKRNQRVLSVVLLTQALVTVIFIFVRSNLPFFAILIPRVIHDLVSMLFYGRHNQKRNSTEKKNLVFRIFHISGGPQLFFATFVISFLLALPLTLTYNESIWTVRIVLSLKTLHYYMEGVTWKKDSPHRLYI